MQFEIEKVRLEKGQDAEEVVRNFIRSQPGKFKNLSSGLYGQVYGSKTEQRLVYKIGDLSENIPYLSYIKTLQQAKELNPHVPVIFRVRLYLDHDHTPRNPSGHFIVAMERLQERHKDCDSLHKGTCQAVHELIYAISDRKKDTVQRLLNAMSPFGRPAPEQQRALREAGKLVVRAAKKASKTGYEEHFDLHDGNFMYRGSTGTLVITDPLS